MRETQSSSKKKSKKFIAGTESSENFEVRKLLENYPIPTY